MNTKIKKWLKNMKVGHVNMRSSLHKWSLSLILSLSFVAEAVAADMGHYALLPKILVNKIEDTAFIRERSNFPQMLPIEKG